RRAGACGPRRRGREALAALPRAGRRQPVGEDRARPPGSRRAAGRDERVNLLVVGGGGREHALCWNLAQSPRLTRLVAAPGNPGIARHATCVAVSVDDHDALVRLADKERPDVVVIGPEVPLVAGLADRLTAAGLAVFGPSARAA